MQIDDIRVFIPSQQFEESIAFYNDLGFKSEAVTNDLMIFENGSCSFFLQRFYNKEFAENLMLQVCVKDIEQAYAKAKIARHKHKISPIDDEGWGRVFYVWGPCGELLHITQLKN